MTLKRWHEEDASAEELQLLAASRAETPDDAAYRKTLAVTLGATAGIASTPASGLFARWLAHGATKVVIGLAAIGAIGGAVALARLGVTTPATEPNDPPRPALVAPVSTVAVAAVEASRPAISAISTVEPVPIDSLPRAVAVRTPPAPLPSSSSSSSGTPALTREIETLDRAQKALAAADTTTATRTLDEYTREFPSGDMAPEATVLRVRVLLAQGRAGAARELADSFAAAHPSSPYTARMLSLVGEKKN